jgi:uncharacterized lipoprotein YajG
MSLKWIVFFIQRILKIRNVLFLVLGIFLFFGCAKKEEVIDLTVSHPLVPEAIR